MKRLIILAVCCVPLSGVDAQEDRRAAPEAPIVAPENAEPVAIPESLQKAAAEFDLDLKQVTVFHEPRNILELSYYGNRRGVPLPHKVSVIMEDGGKRFWIADRFPHPDPTTVAGPFKGNAIKQLDLIKVLRGELEDRNYSTGIQAISGLLKSDDPGHVRLGLEAVPIAMAGRVTYVHSYLHFIERSLPKRVAEFKEMGLAEETELVLASMEEARKRVVAVTVEAELPDYQAGYDPTKEKRNGIGVLPDDAWGEEKNGLQAALTAPVKLQLNERVDLYFVFRNVSEEVLRVSLPEVTGNLRLSYVATPHLSSGGTEGIGGHRQPLTHWSLEPGHQAMVICRPLQIMEEGVVPRPKRAFKNGQPGEFKLWASSGSGDKWAYSPDAEPKLVAVREGDWKGYLKTGTRVVRLLETVAPYELDSPPELGLDHGVAMVNGNPEGLDRNRSTAVPLRAGAYLYLQENDEHWLMDHETFRTTTSWGPMSADRLRELGLLEMVEKTTRELVEREREGALSEGFTRVGALVGQARPIALIGLEFVPDLNLADAHPMHAEHLARTIRNRRPDLVGLGLKKEVRTALEVLAVIDPPLPPVEEFLFVEDQAIPANLPEEAWGPKNDGLQAAALMPKVLEDGAEVLVPLFIRNVSEEDVFLTVADRPEYDHATVTDAEGAALKSRHSTVYPSGFSGFIVPELDPGLGQQNPPLANLIKLRLAPGAVYELKTPTAIVFVKEGGEPVQREGEMKFGTAHDGKPAVTTITAPPIKAMVTWHLHTTNGVARDLENGQRTWPAKGGWSGILTTGELGVSLE